MKIPLGTALLQQPITAFPPWRPSGKWHQAVGFLATSWMLVKEGFAAFIDDNALTRGAAIAFYAITALAPVLFIASGIASLAFGAGAVTDAIHHQMRHIMSRESADLLQAAILNARRTTHTVLGGALGAFALVVTASGMFTEMEDALNVIWKAPRTQSYFIQMLRGRVLSLGLVVVMGFVLMLSMVAAGGVGLLARYLDRTTNLSQLFLGSLRLGLGFLLVTLLFAAIYKIMPNKPIQWRDVILGACGTALLFEIGQSLIGFYLANFISASVYGAAAGVIVLLVWVYYSAQVFLLGAEFTKVWASHYGSQRDS